MQYSAEEERRGEERREAGRRGGKQNRTVNCGGSGKVRLYFIFCLLSFCSIFLKLHSICLCCTVYATGCCADMLLVVLCILHSLHRIFGKMEAVYLRGEGGNESAYIRIAKRNERE